MKKATKTLVLLTLFIATLGLAGCQEDVMPNAVSIEMEVIELPEDIELETEDEEEDKGEDIR